MDEQVYIANLGNNRRIGRCGFTLPIDFISQRENRLEWWIWGINGRDYDTLTADEYTYREPTMEWNEQFEES